MKNYKIFICIISALLLVITIFGLDSLRNKNNKESDALRFKREYEEVNGKEVSGMRYPVLEISDDNPIKYSDVEEVEKILKDGTGVIYFGYPNCPWCRTAVPVLLHAAMDAGVNRIYYIDMANERSTYSVVDGEIKIDKEGTEQYRKLLELFDDYLDDYVIKDNDGKEYQTGEKRIYVPIVFFVKDGEVLSYHLDTVKSQTNPFKQLNDEQYEELYNIYSDKIHDMLGDICTERC